MFERYTKECPCKTCEERHAGCHTADCKNGWPEWHEWQQKRKERIDTRKKREAALNSIGKNKKRKSKMQAGKYYRYANKREDNDGLERMEYRERPEIRE